MTRAFNWLVLGLRFVVVPAWIAAAVLAAQHLPSIAGADASPLGGLVPSDNHAVAAERAEYDAFGSTLISRIAVVQRTDAATAIRNAVDVDRHRAPLLRHIAFALPLANRGTAITFLYFRPEIPVRAQLALAHTYAQGSPGLVGVTGSVPAREAEYDAIQATLPKLTIATIALIVLVLLVIYRALAPPLITIGAAGIVYVVATHVLAWVASKRGLQVPNEVEPVMIALLLGLVTDYSVFYLTTMRRRLAAGASSREAIDVATRANTPIIFTAGLIVAAGGLTLVAGRLPVFRAFGPGLALTVLICLAVALTFIPAALAILGRWAFWPSLRPQPEKERIGWFSRLRATRPASALLGALALAVVGAAALGLRHTALGFTLISGQPADSPLRKAEVAAGRAFAPGIVSPTVLLLRGDGLNAKRAQLVALERALRREPGVARVVGPGETPDYVRTPPVFVNRSGTAARLAIVFDQEPLGSKAIARLRTLRAALPRLLPPGVRADFAGDTAIAAETIHAVRGDLLRIGLALLAANVVLLALFLRALLAPFYLLAASALGLAATLGLTTIVFGGEDITYYVPFAAAVLLLSLGSDYNLFVVGRIWQEKATRPLREAVAYVLPRASGTIAVAGITLAASFALLALVPIRPMHELAFTMAAGILIDTFVVRTFLVPALVVLFSRDAKAAAHEPGVRVADDRVDPAA